MRKKNNDERRKAIGYLKMWAGTFLALLLLNWLTGCTSVTHTTGYMHVSIPSTTRDYPLDMVCQGMRTGERLEFYGNACWDPRWEIDFFVGGVNYVWGQQ